MRFEETRSDVCHQRYVKAGRTVTALARHARYAFCRIQVRPRVGVRHIGFQLGAIAGVCIQAWRPYRKKDIDMRERVQRRATKMIQKLRNLSYEMRLKECGFTTLETRRLRDHI